MKLYAGVTDNQWYKYLKSIQPEDVNFWQPGGNVSFKVLETGAPFLFKLKSPLNAIGGIGFFSSHTFLPLNLAWETFGNRNGTDSYAKFRGMILNYRKDKENLNPTIGCIVLTNPLFFEEEDWIPVPKDWKNAIVQGKSYSRFDPVGAWLWDQLQSRLEKYLLAPRNQKLEESEWLQGNEIYAGENEPIYGKSYLRNVRMGQGAFRVLITDAYSRRCSVSGEKTLPVLEAAHIKAYAESGPNITANGLLLRSDIHRLFDSGYVTITTDHKIEVSGRIREEFENGREYYQYQGKPLIHLPAKPSDRPNRRFIEWHNEKVYLG